MNGETISPLRRRMIEDMTVRKFVEKTQRDYIRHVKGLPTTRVRREGALILPAAFPRPYSTSGLSVAG
jgi:hypothetical protein